MNVVDAPAFEGDVSRLAATLEAYRSVRHVAAIALGALLLLASADPAARASTAPLPWPSPRVRRRPTSS